MEFVKRSWLQIKAQLEGLTASQKWLIGTLLVLGTLIIGMLLTVAGKPEMVPISQFASNRSDEVLARLRAAGIDAEQEGNQVRVPVERRDEAILLLVEGDLLGDDAAAAFDAMIGGQSPWMSEHQNKQAYQLAKQKVLAGILRKMKGVRDAHVVIDMPQNKGFGPTHVKPSASITVTTEGRGVDKKQLVEAVAALVSGAVAEMDATGVAVIVDGRKMKVNDVNEMLPTDALEMVRSLEEYHSRKITEQLSYIPGVRVAVHVLLDNVSSKAQEAFQYEKAEPLRRSFERETTQRDVRDAGEPGVLPNVGLDIAGGGAAGTEMTSTESENEFGDKPLVLREQTKFTGHTMQRINVTVNVPRSYFVQIFKAQNPANNAEPDEAALAPIVSAQLAQIQQGIEPLIQTNQSEGEVVAMMIPDASLLMPGQDEPQVAGFGAILVDGGWAKPVGVGVLALISLALMLGMVRKATQQEVLPSVEELAGVPPRLPTEDELVGEAEEMEQSLAGVELDEDEIRSRKIASQISDLIRANPDEAGALLGRWVRRDD